MDGPFTKSVEYKLMQADGVSGKVSLLTKAGETKDNLSLPTFERGTKGPCDKNVVEDILNMQDRNVGQRVTVLTACNIEKIVSTREEQDEVKTDEKQRLLKELLSTAQALEAQGLLDIGSTLDGFKSLLKVGGLSQASEEKDEEAVKA